MNKQQSNQMASMRKKLLAAIAMLLVACIMTVSSTYAWFTLSTAPEVKGISTTIGANGNLEMALGTYDTFFGSADPSSYVGSSAAITGDYTVSNITWGNLVDLSTGYDLDKITLYPTRLNSDAGNLINRTNPLKYPKYGSDGRVTELSPMTLVGDYDSVSNGFISTPGQTATGVSAIGSASTMSKREFAVMNGKADQKKYHAAATNAAKDAIRLYGGKLAAIALQYQSDDGTGTVVEADIAVLKSLIAKLQESNTAISESMKSALLVVLASTELDVLDDATWEIAAGLAKTNDLRTFVNLIGQDYGGVSIPSDVEGIITQYEAIQAKIDAADAALPESGDGNWGAIKNSVSALLVASGIKVGGYTISEIKTAYGTGDEGGVGMSSNTVKDLFNKVSAGTLSYTFTATSGIFADIAALTGPYTSSMEFPEGTVVEGLDLNMLGSKPVDVESAVVAELKTLSDVTTLLAMEGFEAPSGDPNAAKTLTDTYGYIIDLLFRTNATESDLLLQTAAKNRYTEGAVEETEGNGSNFTFTINAEYTQEKINGLAAGIRVVFFDGENNILGVATLDTVNGTLAGDAYKMNLELHEYTIAADGTITVGAVKSDAVLTALTANEKTAISALVYLDGDVIDNSHAGTNEGLDATVNLQFASSVELKPMENADLMGQ